MYNGTLIRLRSIEVGDAERLLTWVNDPEVTQHLAMRYPVSVAQEQDWIAANKTVGYDCATFAVETIAEGRHIGTIDIRAVSAENRSGELGLMIGDKSAWGQGYGTDMVRTACRFGFNEMNLHRIGLTVHAGNERAIHVYQKVGFQREGLARQAWYANGRYHDEVLMGLLTDEFEHANEPGAQSGSG